MRGRIERREGMRGLKWEKTKRRASRKARERERHIGREGRRKSSM